MAFTKHRLESLANANCKKCYGRGYVGRWHKVGQHSAREVAFSKEKKIRLPGLPKIHSLIACRCALRNAQLLTKLEPKATMKVIG